MTDPSTTPHPDAPIQRHDPAPWPTSEQGATADALVAYFAGQGIRFAAQRAHERQHGTVGSDRWYAALHGEMLAAHTVCALSTLQTYARTGATRAARDIWVLAEAAEHSEFLWEAAADVGLDPQHIHDEATAALEEDHAAVVHALREDQR